MEVTETMFAVSVLVEVKVGKCYGVDCTSEMVS